MTKLHVTRDALCIGALKITADDEVKLLVDARGDWVELAVGLNSQRFFMTDEDVVQFLSTLIKSVAREDWFNGSQVDSVILLGADLIALWEKPKLSDYPNAREEQTPAWATPFVRSGMFSRNGVFCPARELPDSITDFHVYRAKRLAWKSCENYSSLLRDEPQDSEARLHFWRQALDDKMEMELRVYRAKRLAWKSCENYKDLLRDEPQDGEARLRYWQQALDNGTKR
jgi:hypothetical protein